MEKTDNEAEELGNTNDDNNKDQPPLRELEDGLYTKNPLDDPEEYQHLKDVCSAFVNYQIDSLRDIAKTEKDFSSLIDEYKSKLIYDYNKRIDKLKHSVLVNYHFLLKVIAQYSHMFKYNKTVFIKIK